MKYENSCLLMTGDGYNRYGAIVGVFLMGRGERGEGEPCDGRCA